MDDANAAPQPTLSLTGYQRQYQQSITHSEKQGQRSAAWGKNWNAVSRVVANRNRRYYDLAIAATKH